MTTLFAASCCFGVMAVLVRLAARELDALEVAWVRFAGSFVLLVALSRGRGLRPRAGNLGPLVLRGLLGASAIVCYFAGIARAGAGLATLLHSIYPVFTALWGVVLLGQGLTGRVVAALALSAFGASIVLHDQLGQGPAVLTGVGLSLLGGVLAGGAVLTAGELRRTESASLVTVWFMVVGAVVTAPALVDGMPWPTPALAAALGGVVIASATGQWLLHHGLGFVSPTLGSLAVATSVVTASVLEALVMGQTVRGGVVAGGVLMLAAVGLATTARRVPPPVAEHAGGR